MKKLLFTPNGEWIRLYQKLAHVGLTGKGIKGDIVYVELPEIGQHVTKGEPCATVEAVKSVIEVNAPQSGVVHDVNDVVYDDPDLISKQPMQTWLVSVAFEGEPDLTGLSSIEE